jgi:putative transposase
VRYAFIKAQNKEFPVSRLCQWLDVHPSGYYAWDKKPHSARAVENQRLTGLIKQFWLESGGIYGYRKIYSDLRDYGESCGVNRVYRLMRTAGLKAQVGYRRPRYRGGKVSIVAPNHLQRKFNVTTPNETWVTDITYIRTHEGWLYLAVVLDLFSRKVIGWSMQPRITKELAIDALLMAVWRRKPASIVTVHSDQGVQYTSHDWQHFLQANGLKASMSRRGNCHDNAVAESFFQLLKRERIKRHVFTTREQARSEIFDYIEMFYNTKRRHGYNNQLSPVEYEKRYKNKTEKCL